MNVTERTKRPIDAVVLFGGGLDSCALVEMKQAAGESLALLYFEYGAKAGAAERVAMKYLCDRYEIPSYFAMLPYLLFPSSAITSGGASKDHRDDFVPGRNLIFASLAYPLAVKLRASTIYLGASPAADLSGEWKAVCNDMGASFVESFNETLRKAYGNSGPRLSAPLLEYAHKVDYAREALAINPELFDYSHSCYQSNKVGFHCGHCQHCLDRNAIRDELGLDRVA